MKFFFIFLFFCLSLNAKTYSLYLVSSKYANVANEYHKEIQFLLNSPEKLIVKVTANKKYSVLIKEIPNITKAKELQRIFKLINKFEDSYIKKVFDSKKEKKETYLLKKKKKKVKKKIKKKKINKKIKKKVKKKKKKKVRSDSPTLYNHNVESTNEYITASIMYNVKEYTQAYNLFKKLFTKYNFNINVNYFLAQSAIKINKADEAIAILERILIQNPKSHKIRFEFAKLLMDKKLLEESEGEFKKLLKSNINQGTKQKINNILVKLDKNKKTYFGRALLLIGLNRSSNINNGLENIYYKLPGLNNIIIQGESPIKDSYLSSMFNINIYYPIKQNKNLLFKNSFLFYKENFQKVKSSNSLFLKYEIKLSYYHKNNIYALALSASRVNQYLDNDFNIFSFTSSLNKNKFYTYLQYRQIHYLNNKYKGKEYKKIAYHLNYSILNNFKYYTTISKNVKKYDLRTDIDKYSFANGFNYFYKINKKNEVSFEYEININKYKEKNFFLDSTRKDINHNILLEYKYLIKRGDNINIGYTHTRNNSNQDPYKYKINKISLSYIKSISW